MLNYCRWKSTESSETKEEGKKNSDDEDHCWRTKEKNVSSTFRYTHSSTQRGSSECTFISSLDTLSEKSIVI